MSEIVISNLFKSFGANEVLQGLTFEVNKGYIYGVVGNNGCGKSTLFKVMTGELKEDSGDIFLRNGCKLGYLEQMPKMADHILVKDVLDQAFADLHSMEQQMRDLEMELSQGSSDQDTLLKRYSNLQIRYESNGGHRIPERMKKVTQGLQIGQEMQNSAFQSLSGGEKTRVLLGKLLLSETDILLLDEPTNHLDIQSIEWLEQYIQSYEGTVIMISHDRYFLDKVAEQIIEIHRGKAVLYKGNYSSYQLEKQEREEREAELFERQQKEIKRLSERARQLHDWANNEKTHRKAFAIEKRVERLVQQQVEKPQADKKIKISVNAGKFTAKELLSIQHLSFQYGTEKCIFQDAELNVFRGENIAILGPNGCGKTTLLKLILNELEAQAGKIQLGKSVSYAYLPQNVVFENEGLSILEFTQRALDLTAGEARNLLARYRFTGEEVKKEIGILSGGEKSRLRLCILLQGRINLLILDEPTNHLDIASREVLEDMLEDYEGALLFVSHDRYFIRKFANRIADIQQKQIKKYLCDYDTFRLEKEQEESEMEVSAEIKDAKQPRGKQEEEKKKERRAKDPYRIQKAAETEAEITTKEEALEAIEQKLFEDGIGYETVLELTEEKQKIEQEIEELLLLWEKYSSV